MPANGQRISPILTDNDSVRDKGKGGVLNQLPSLKEQAELTRDDITRFNNYKDLNGQRYGSTHPDAQSDGDDCGRGEVSPNGGVGTKTDKVTKDTLLYSSGNKWKPGKGYCGYDYNEEYW